MNNFHEDLKRANDTKLDPFWLSVYTKMFPNIAHMSGTINNMQMQFKGVDRIITLKNNRHIFIDEKIRERDYNDILLEDSSKVINGVVKSTGWMNKSLDIDYLAYAFRPSQTCYLLPWANLQSAWFKYRTRLINKYGTVEAKNDGYVTLSVPVPIESINLMMQESFKIKV